MVVGQFESRSAASHSCETALSHPYETGLGPRNLIHVRLAALGARIDALLGYVRLTLRVWCSVPEVACQSVALLMMRSDFCFSSNTGVSVGYAGAPAFRAKRGE